MKNRINSTGFLLVAVSMLVITSCRVGKEYQRPQLELPEQFNGVSVADTSSIADIQWKQFFTDTALQRLIDQGLRYNHDLLLAANRLQIARKRVDQSKLLLLPDANLQFTAQYLNPSNNSLNGKTANSFIGKSYIENYQGIVSLSWEADIWGKISRQKEATLANYLQTYEGVKAVQTQLVADIAQGFFNLLMLDRQLEIAHDNLALSDSFLIATRLLKNAGMTNALAVQQAESQKQSIAILIPQLEEEIKIQENAIQILTGRLPGSISRRVGLTDFVLPENLSTGLPAVMVSRRPDVRSAEMAIVAANAEVGLSQAMLYPALNITAGVGIESFQNNNWFNLPASLFGLAAGSIAQPIFQRGRLKTAVETAKLEREGAAIEFRQTVLRAISEVSDALVRIDKLKLQEQITAAQVDTLQQAVSYAKLLFRSDMANYLEVITAQGNALDAQLNLAAIRRRQLSAMV